MFLYTSKLVILFLIGLYSGLSAIFASEFTQITEAEVANEIGVINQTNTCDTGANCVNHANIGYFEFADDGSIVYSTSDQTVTQSNTCSDTANCMNVGTLMNGIAGSSTAIIDSKISQKLNQACYATNENCLNYNTLIE